MNQYTFRRSARIVERDIKPVFAISPDEAYSFKRSFVVTEHLSTLTEVAVQVRFFGLWIDVWSETCEADDAGTLTFYRNCAEEVRDKLCEEVW